MDRRRPLLDRQPARRVVRGVRRVRKLEEDAADPKLAVWRMRATKTYDDDGNAVYRIVLPAEEAAVVDAALEAMQAELDRRAAGASAEELLHRQRCFRGRRWCAALPRKQVHHRRRASLSLWTLPRRRVLHSR